MAHTHTTIRIHVVFSTARRTPSIPEERQSRLWAYMAGVGRNHDTPVHAVGGTFDHAHLLISLPPNLTLAKAVQNIKAVSSKWMGQGFQWQQGYGAFSVSASNVAKVLRYIENQPEHHRKQSFEDEFRGLLRAHNVDFDEQFLLG